MTRQKTNNGFYRPENVRDLPAATMGSKFYQDQDSGARLFYPYFELLGMEQICWLFCGTRSKAADSWYQWSRAIFAINIIACGGFPLLLTSCNTIGIKLKPQKRGQRLSDNLFLLSSEFRLPSTVPTDYRGTPDWNWQMTDYWQSWGTVIGGVVRATPWFCLLTDKWCKGGRPIIWNSWDQAKARGPGQHVV